MQNNSQTNNQGQQDDQPESVLNIIRKEFFDMGGHDKDDDVKSEMNVYALMNRVTLLWFDQIGCSTRMQGF